MSFTRYGFPATFGTEADPMAGLFDPYVHTSADRMDLISGEFSLEVSVCCFDREVILTFEV